MTRAAATRAISVDEGRPFLKWAGGKRQLLEELKARMPETFNGYFEPFVGGGALFFARGHTPATLCDRNTRLIRTYWGIQRHVDDVIGILSGYRYSEEEYYRIRDQVIDEKTDAEVAAWFIYLNKTGFNGLYRVNSKNRFNVPIGRYSRPNICDEDTLRACARALERATIIQGDFEDAVARAKKDDFVYFDPPYVPLSPTSSFTSYTSDGFDSNAQRRLRDRARSLVERGVHVLLSNSDHEEIWDLYAGPRFKIERVAASRGINCKGNGRGDITEVVITGVRPQRRR